MIVSGVSGALGDCVWGIRCCMCLCLGYQVLYVLVSEVSGALCAFV